MIYVAVFYLNDVTETGEERKAWVGENRDEVVRIARQWAETDWDPNEYRIMVGTLTDVAQARVTYETEPLTSLRPRRGRRTQTIDNEETE